MTTHLSPASAIGDHSGPPYKPSSWRLSDFDFDLPPELIAQKPCAQRTQSRLLIEKEVDEVDRGKTIHFFDLPQYLEAGDVLVLNNTQVIKARFQGHKASGGRVEVLVEQVLSPESHLPFSMEETSFSSSSVMSSMTSSVTSSAWRHQFIAQIGSNKKVHPGLHLFLGEDQANGGKAAFEAYVLARCAGCPSDSGGITTDSGLFVIACEQDPYELMARWGQVPLPPYIQREASTPHDQATDETRYQTVFASQQGAVAAPTAGLHFDQALLDQLQAQGVHVTYVTLHVGAGTFSPIRAVYLDDHVMHAERYVVPPETQAAIAQCQAQGKRVVAVGTTSLRALESWAQTGCSEGSTRLFIRPGFVFRIVDALITNFHLPQSTLMVLVCAFAGYEHVMKLYQTAIAQRYRFFSYGDAMWLDRFNTAKR
jgi:S-adenosylmethionine:tRNA ribosyltransferase-isomerase